MTRAYYSNSSEVYNTYDKDDLGFVYSKEKTTFKVWAPAATLVSLRLFKTGFFREEGAAQIGITPMELDNCTGVWSVTIDGDLHGVYYTYLIQNDDRTTETQDVYSKATGVNSSRSMVVDLDKTNPDGWENDAHVFVDKPTDAIVWEVHIRDFSSSSSSGVSKANSGTYLAFTETGTTIPCTKFPTCLDYLKDLGITHVQLNPVFDFGSVNEVTCVDYNWGYDPVNYCVPEGSYSTDPYHGEVRIKEFKEMVKSLHDNNIGVIMDVVYNHVYSTADSCFEKTVPGYYFRNNNGKYLNSSGCGNVTASEKTMFRKYMIDSVVYWAKEYHIDGFRFDLMACHDVDTMNIIREELDKIDKRILIYGEPWSANMGENGIDGGDACTKDSAKRLSCRIGMFNDDMRHGIKGGSDDDGKGYIQGNMHSAYSVIAGTMGASSSTFGNWAKAPSQCVTYASAHDNLTLWDKILKSNWCNDYNTTDNLYIKQNKLAATLTLMSLGMPFFLAGEEFARTKNGDHNSYKSPDSINSIDWRRTVTYRDLVQYYKGLIKIRKAFSPLTDSSESAVNRGYVAYSGSAISVVYTNDDNIENEYKYLAIVVNGSNTKSVFELKSNHDLPKRWYVLANGNTASDKAICEFDNVMEIPERSTLILCDAESYDRLHSKNNFVGYSPMI